MKTQKGLLRDNDQFSSSLYNEILVIKEKRHIFHFAKNIESIFNLYDYMDHVLTDKTYNALVMFAPSERDMITEYSYFVSRILSGDGPDYLERFFNVVNKFILSLSTINHMTIFAAQGTVSMFHLNTALAYDYRIVAEDTVFENLNRDIGLVTKGSGYFLPRLLGIQKATEVLQWKSFSAEDALHLGLVDQIVPESKLEEETMQFVSGNQAQMSSTLLDLRKLFKCDIKELKRSLELEDELIRERLRSDELRLRLTANRESPGRLL